MDLEVKKFMSGSFRSMTATDNGDNIQQATKK